MTADFKAHVCRSRDGLDLFARDYGQPNDRPPVICIPGLTRNSRDFEEVAPWIAARGWRVLAVDLRGRGRSGRGPKRGYRPPVYAEDIVALMESIGAPKAIFVGTSLGGLVTFALATKDPDRIAGVVLNDVGPRVAKTGLTRIRAYAGNPVAVETWDEAAAYARRTNAAAFPNYGEADWRAVARRLFREENGRPVLDYDAAIFSAPPVWLVRMVEPLLWSAFRTLVKAGPVMLVHGELTDVIDGPTRDRMKQLAPEMGMTAVPDVGHAPMLTEPAAREALAAFLERLGSDGAAGR